MRLKSVKLAGFKSFIDPTTVSFKSNLTAIVGPNGSGKSNVIDAVRWVMGESSAKYLRGESMADVIFNGSTKRKPAAHASIELIFDNHEGKLGGEYASFTQISVKRQVTRDGQSHYFLNGARCRRKDITDLFRGTGLGPRSYAIIMQDTISRLIEAKPEELRNYLEEVAGISKYKDRRRETELRIRHTRENLERLTDLREELEKQINHLDRQAKAAERFKVLKEEERLTKAQFHTLQWQGFDHQLQEQKQSLLELETAVEEAVASIRHIDAEFERQRDGQIEATDKVNEAQGHYYSIGAEIGRLEQTKQHQQERQQQLQEDYQQALESFEQSQQQLTQDQLNLEELQKSAEALTPELTHAQEQADTANDALVTAEEALRNWQNRWDDFNTQSAKAQQLAEVEQTRIQHLQQRHQELQQRVDQLQTEHSELDFSHKDQTVIELQDKVLNKSKEQEQSQQQIDELRNKINEKREQLQHIHNELDQEREQSQQLRGKYASLEALQQAALGQKDDEVVQWLQDHQLLSKPRLGEDIKVTPGWELAVETVLGNYLEAICVDGIGSVTDYLQDLSQGNVSFIDITAMSNNNGLSGHPSLADKVESAPSVKALLANVAIADSLEEALSLVKTLNSQQSLITKEGIWIGQGWLRVTHGQKEQSGVIERQKDLTELKQQMSAKEQDVAELVQTQLENRDELHHLESQRDEQQQSLRHISSDLAELQAQLKVQQSQLQQQHQRVNELKNLLSKTSEQIESTQGDLQTAQDSWQQAVSSTEQDARARQQLLEERDKCHADVESHRNYAREHKDSAHQLALRYESITTQVAALSNNVERTQKQLVQLTERKENLQALLENADKPIEEIEARLAVSLEQQLAAEKVLTAARQQLASIDHSMRELTEQRHLAEESSEKVRNDLEQKRMHLENIKVRRTTLEEQLQEMEHDLQELIKEMPEDANEQAWQDKLDSLQRRIQRLGAINLAAIDEFKEVSERKEYLDKQNEDLEDALTTLENAIGKIDRESRQKFKETYETVNSHFQHLFPKIFSGGSGSLELTGEDLLETGITVMARPPGKRNTHIHLLSGGEKALTALALVFSMFQINPAPFCLLDEVDAPLDDANITRFCNLVKEMAKEVQFLFISHNKLAIEMADQLIGVTMREPGVSRLVAVDVDEAVSMAEA